MSWDTPRFSLSIAVIFQIDFINKDHRPKLRRKAICANKQCFPLYLTNCFFKYLEIFIAFDWNERYFSNIFVERLMVFFRWLFRKKHCRWYWLCIFVGNLLSVNFVGGFFFDTLTLRHLIRWYLKMLMTLFWLSIWWCWWHYFDIRTFWRYWGLGFVLHFLWWWL